MVKYAYSATTVEGTVVTGTEVASTLQSANSALLARGLRPVDLKEQRSLWKFEITKEKAKRREIMHFSHQLAVFIRAGIPLLEALEAIALETPSKVLRATLDDMGARLRGGESLADAAEAHPESFPQFYVSVLRSSELTGNLDEALDQLGEYIERDIETRQQVTSALVYPAVTLAMAAVAAAILTLWVLPRFEEFFDSFDAELPLVTRVLLGITRFLGNWGALLIAVVAAITVGAVLASRTDRGRGVLDRALLRVPVVGDMLAHAVIERFCRVMASMMTAGVPLPIALNVAADVSNNRAYRDGILQARAAMLEGEQLADPLAATNLFPGSANQMFHVGEDTGTLDDQMRTAAHYFGRELAFKIKRFTSLFEPAVILFIGVVVGFVAVAMVSAMYGIYDQVEGV